MNKLSKEEFIDRITSIAEARKIFIPHITKNITIAFQLYQEILADKERSLFLKSINSGNRMQTILDKYERPKCPKCKEYLRLRLISIPRGIKNKFGYKSCWMCDNTDCYYEDYSTKGWKEWLEILEKKGVK
uniref:Uncharacterized protein n=1 Tax=viral metagenome TaxID=1070528 RepID=A0A6M3KIL3_9ZZZZ